MMKNAQNIFVSYARPTLERVKKLVSDLQKLEYTVWYDRELSGGQKWWDEILKNIRACDIFVVALCEQSIQSMACQAERKYAKELGKTIICVKLCSFDDKLLPKDIAEINYIDYRHRSVESYQQLSKALSLLPPSQPLPDPLPDSPAAPLSPMGAIKERIDDISTLLTPRQQGAFLTKLEPLLTKPDTREPAELLLSKLRERSEITLKNAQIIDSLLTARDEPSLDGKSDRVSQRIGLVRVHTDCDAHWFCDLFNNLTKGQELLWHDTYCPHWNELREAIRHALDHGARIRMLVIDPDCDNACFRAEELRDWGDCEKFKLEDSAFLKVMQGIADDACASGISPAPMQVRLYRDLPGIPMYIVLEAGEPIYGFSSFFLTKATGFNFVHLEWKPSECGLLQLMTLHFEAKWQRQFTLSPTYGG